MISLMAICLVCCMVLPLEVELEDWIPYMSLYKVPQCWLCNRLSIESGSETIGNFGLGLEDETNWRWNVIT